MLNKSWQEKKKTERQRTTKEEENVRTFEREPNGGNRLNFRSKKTGGIVQDETAMSG